MNLKTLQEENSAWSLRNFGPPKDSLDPPGAYQAARAVACAGGLAHAILKADQGIRGTAEEHADRAFERAILLADHATGVIADQRHGDGQLVGVVGIRNAFGAAEEVGELMDALLVDNDAQARDAVGDITIYLANLCDNRGWDYAEIVRSVWSEVKRRDWTKNKADGSA